MGRVKSCNASAAHSLIEGNLRRASQPNKSLTFTIIAKDENDDQLTTGRHMVTATFIDRPAAGKSEVPNVEIRRLQQRPVQAVVRYVTSRSVLRGGVH